MSQKTVVARRGRRQNGAAASGTGLASRLKAYAQDNPGDLGHVVDELLRSPPAAKEFADLISWIARERRVLVRPQELARLCGLDKDVFDPLCRELSRSGDDQVLTVLGFVLGGMGRSRPERLFEMMRKRKISGIPMLGAVRIAGMAGHRIPGDVASAVLRCASSKDRYTREMAIRVSVEQLHGHEGTIRKMARLAKSDDETRVWIARCVASSNISPESGLLLLKECAKISEEKNLTAVAAFVSLVATRFPLECLGMVKAWMKKFDSASTDHQICWIAEQIGASKTTDFARIEGFLLDWINAECRKSKWKNRALYAFLEFSLPRLIHDIYKCRQGEFFSLVSKIDYKNRNKKDVIVRIIETFFSKSFHNIKKDINENCADLLARIAVHYKIDQSIQKNLPSPVMQTLAFVQNIRTGKEIIDPARARRNLGQFPGISEFLTRKKIHELIDDDRNHPLVRLLARSVMTKSALKKFERLIGSAKGEYKARLLQVLVGRHHPWIHLSELDGILGSLSPKGIEEVRRLLLNEGFHQASTQLSVYARFRRGRYRVQLEPKLNNPAADKPKRADLLVRIRDTDCYFELYQPENPGQRELDYIRTAHVVDPSKTKAKIRSKISKKLGAAEHLDSPVILVIDDRHLSVSDLEVRDLLEGSLLLKAGRDGRGAPKAYMTRADDAFNRVVGPHGDVLSAAILLRREVDDSTLKVRLRGDIYENPGARSPLSGEITEEIRGVLFG